MAELANMHRAVVMVPNEKLPGRHQVKNAEVFAKAKAAIVVKDEDMVAEPGLLLSAVRGLMRDVDKRERLARNLQEFAMADASERLAKMVVLVGSRNGKRL